VIPKEHLHTFVITTSELFLLMQV